MKSSIILLSLAIGDRCTKFTPKSDSTLCVCDADYCDKFIEKEVIDGFVNLFETSRSGKRLESSKYVKTEAKKLKFNELDLSGAKKQEILGFGGALTDAAMININTLDSKTRERLEQAWFGEVGAKFNLVRVPIGGSDFSTHPYTLDDYLDDYDLENFALSEFDLQRIELFKKYNLSVLGSAWSAPAWMKDNNELNGYTKIKGDPGDCIHKSWANHYVKYITELKKHEVNVWAITTQNEPSMGLYVNSAWNANSFTPDHLRGFVEKDLIPAIMRIEDPKPKIFNLDDQRLFMPKLTDYLYTSEIIKNYTDGVAVHWYWDQLVKSNVLDDFHQKYPNQTIISSEACLGDFTPGPEMAFESVWYYAERYAVDIIDTLNHWTAAWLDWNMALDFKGGPNWAENRRNACIHVDNNKFYKAPCFYILTHFSRFFTPGTKVIDIPEKYKRKVLLGQQSNGLYVGVILNNSPNEISYNIRQENLSFPVSVQAHSLVSFITN